ncbi:MAG: sn-glycerol-1-phosphate dehydrogenase [Halanaerobiales bacterium]
MNVIKDIIIEKGALKEVPELVKELAGNKKIYIISDENTFQAAGKELSRLLKPNNSIKKIILKGEHVVANTDYFFKILTHVNRDGFLIACGSGSINDLTRYLSYKLEIPYLVVATAPSMDGYASSVAPITVDGVKETYNAAAPQAIVADIDILREAPVEMIQAGFGDLIGKITSLMDWQLSSILFGIELNERSITLVQKELIKVIERAGDLNGRIDESIKDLTRGLINSGIAMQIEGNSRPASGTEHHISHFLEMYGEIHNTDIPPHGIKVAIGEFFAAGLYLKLYETDFSELKNVDDFNERKKRIKKNYLDRARPVLETLEGRWEKDRLDMELLREKEDDIKALIEENREYLVHVADYLNKAGIFARKDVKRISRSWLLAALQSAFEIRDRYTVATLLNQVGLLEKWSYQLVDDFFEVLKY